MKNTTEQTISVLVPKGASDIRVRVLEQERKVEITYCNVCIAEEKDEETNTEEVKGTQEYLEKYFPVVKASTLSLEDNFLKHEPKSKAQRDLKERLTKAIESGLSDFRAQRMDPTLDEEGKIYYQAGKKPAVGRKTNWWKKNAEEFMPEKESRIGTNKERTTFLGLLIKYLIEERGYTVSNAWKAVCDQSKDLGHYWDSENAKYGLEPTGSRQVGDWYDLANTYKIIIDDEAGDFLLVGGDYTNDGDLYPLEDVGICNNLNSGNYHSVAWLVLSV